MKTKTKTITLIEYTYILNAYPAEVEISVEDFEKLETGKMNMNTILNKYPYEDDISVREFKEVELEKKNMETIINKYDIKYEGYSEPLYDFSIFDSYKYEGEVV